MAENASRGLLSSFRLLLGDVLDVGRTRLALLANEVEEEKIRLAGVLANGILALACLILGVVMLVAFLVAAFWESRLLILGGATLAFAAAAFVFMQRAGAGLNRGSGLFKASLAELETDVSALRRPEAGHEPPAS